MTQIITMSEGKTLEFKRNLSSPKNILKTLVAFANSAGGRLLVGVEDGTREVLYYNKHEFCHLNDSISRIFEYLF